MAFGAIAATEHGWSVTVRPYAVGEPGIRQSLDEVARLMRLAKDDPDVKKWAVHALAERGIDGRDQPSIRAQCTALLNAFRAQTIYVPDSAGAEHIQAAHVTLCLRDRCIPGEDCESLCIGLGGAMLAIGLPAYAVKVSFGGDHQQHLMLGAIDSYGEFYLDPSTNKPLMDTVPGAVEITWVDPLQQIGTLGSVGPEIVTLGSPLHERELYFKSGVWLEHRHGRWWSHRNGGWSEVRSSGFGKPFARDGRWWMQADGVDVELTEKQVYAFGLGQITPENVTSQTPYTRVTGDQAHAGLRYRVGMQLGFASDPSQMDPQAISGQFSSDWYIESFDAQDVSQFVPGINQWIQSFVMQGIALRDHQLVTTDTVNYLIVAVQSASGAPTSPGASAPIASVPKSNGNVGLVAASAAAAVVGGVGYSLWKHGVFRSRHG